LAVIEDVLREVDEIIIVIGSTQQSHEIDNPFTTGERITMIRGALIEDNISALRYWIIPVPDLNTHMLWVSQVLGYTPQFEVVYTNEPLTKRLFIEAGFKVKSVPYHDRKIYSATEIRKQMLNGKNWQQLVPDSTAKFIEEIDGVQRLRDLAKTDKI
jgi:nicotinamide-nucleotide adenylyltransferase